MSNNHEPLTLVMVRVQTVEEQLKRAVATGEDTTPLFAEAREAKLVFDKAIGDTTYPTLEAITREYNESYSKALEDYSDQKIRGAASATMNKLEYNRALASFCLKFQTEVGRLLQP